MRALHKGLGRDGRRWLRGEVPDGAGAGRGRRGGRGAAAASLVMAQGVHRHRGGHDSEEMSVFPDWSSRSTSRFLLFPAEEDDRPGRRPLPPAPYSYSSSSALFYWLGSARQNEGKGT